MSWVNGAWIALKPTLVLWLLGILLVVIGVSFGTLAGKVAVADWSWNDTITTTGKVLITDWQHVKNDNRLRVMYSYKDDNGAIYHNTGVLARVLGKNNLVPGSIIAVRYRPQEHRQSRLQIELSAGEWLPLMLIAILEVAAGVMFLLAAIKKYKATKMSKVIQRSGESI